MVTSLTRNDAAAAPDAGILFSPSPPLPLVSPTFVNGSVIDDTVAVATLSHGGGKGAVYNEGDDGPSEELNFFGVGGIINSRLLQSPLCTQGYVDCVNGVVNGSPGT